LAVLSSCLKDEELEDGSSRTVLSIHPALAPIKVAVLPLVKKDGLPEKAREIMNLLKFDHNCHYEEKDTIGKRYRRHDAIGTPICIGVDYETLDDNMVTIRDRDTMEQVRVAIVDLPKIIDEKVSMRNLLV
jgi:glycyl-tRNA synthetase